MLKVLRQRDFALLWFAGFISITCDWMLTVALPITVYQLTDSPLATAGLLIAGRVPAVVLGTVAGVYVDRWDRKRTMVIVNLLRAPVLLLLLAVDSVDQLWIVYVVAFTTSALGQFFSPAENALLPRLVGEEHLIPANALNALNNNLARLVGPAIGGVVAGVYGLDGVVVVDAASFLVAGAMIAAIATPAKPEKADLAEVHVAGRWAALWEEWLSGLRMVRGNRNLCVVFGVIAISGLGEGVFGTAFWVYVDEVLDGGELEAGWLMSAQAVGGLIGALAIGAWAKGASPAKLLGWGAIGLGAIDLLIINYPAFVGGVWLGIALFIVVGLPVAAFGTGYTTTIQTEVTDAYRGRVFGSLNTTMSLLMIVGAAIAGFATETFGVVAVLTIDSVAYVVAGLFALKLMGVATAVRLTKAEQGGEAERAGVS